MYNGLEMIYNSPLVLNNIGLLFYWPISIVHDYITSWCDTTDSIRPWNHQNQPCHGNSSMNTKSNNVHPFYIIVSCCFALGLAKFVLVGQIWTTACFAVRPGRTPNLMNYGWLLFHCWLSIHRGLKDLFLCTSFASFNTIYCCVLLYLLLGCRPMSSHAPIH